MQGTSWLLLFRLSEDRWVAGDRRPGPGLDRATAVQGSMSLPTRSRTWLSGCRGVPDI